MTQLGAIRADNGKTDFTLIDFEAVKLMCPETPFAVRAMCDFWLRQAEAEAVFPAITRTLLDEFGQGRSAAELIAPVLAMGAIKYSSWNWALGFKWSRCYNSFTRHLLGYTDGDGQFYGGLYSGATIDHESDLPHVGHALCNVKFLAAHVTRRLGEDDRPVGVFREIQGA